MVGSFIRLAAAAAVSAALAGCTSAPDTSYYPGHSGYSDYSGRPDTTYDDAYRTVPDKPLQCVPYAREVAHIPIYGDAYTWWDQADGRYARSRLPSDGAVMLLYNYAGPRRGHLAVVKEVVGEREIIVDHANWLDDGAIYRNDPVRDVSAAGDWSRVRVFNIKTGAWGARVYPVRGFIGPGRDTGALRLARTPSAEAPPDDPIGALIAAQERLSDEDN